MDVGRCECISFGEVCGVSLEEDVGDKQVSSPPN